MNLNMLMHLLLEACLHADFIEELGQMDERKDNS